MSNTDNSDFLMRLKTRIEKGKQNLADTQAEQKVILRQLKEDYNCLSIEEAEEKVKKLQKKLNKETESINAIIADLREKYDVITDSEK